METIIQVLVGFIGWLSTIVIIYSWSYAIARGWKQGWNHQEVD